MANKALFAPAAPVALTTVINNAGGAAFKFEDKHALAQFATTGCFNNSYYETSEQQLEKLLELLPKLPNEFIAKTAVYAREKGHMKDAPAALVAYLAAKDVKLAAKVFPKVIDSGKMLRNFTQFIRSGKFGRKSLGSAPKRWVQQWFATRSPETIFRQSLGSSPSVADVIKLSRPKPENKTKEALYAYLLQAKGHEGKFNELPQIVKDFEFYKRQAAFQMPDVPFEMLTALPLTASEWKTLARRMSWTQLRMNLNTLARHGVFEDFGMVGYVANKLRDPELIKRTGVFPYQLLTTYLAVAPEREEDKYRSPFFASAPPAGTKTDLPTEIILALQDALEISVDNVPAIDGRVVVCPDTSGSMQSPVTGVRKGSTTKTRYVDIAALVAAAFIRKNPLAQVLPFDTEVHKANLNPRDSVATNAKYLASFGGGGTACQAPLAELNRTAAMADLVVYVSDNESWAQYGDESYRSYYNNDGPPMAEEWRSFKQRNPKAKLVLLDITPNDTTQVQTDPDVLNIGGFSDSAFELISLFAKGELSPDQWVGEIEKVEL